MATQRVCAPRDIVFIFIISIVIIVVAVAVVIWLSMTLFTMPYDRDMPSWQLAVRLQSMPSWKRSLQQRL